MKRFLNLFFLLIILAGLCNLSGQGKKEYANPVLSGFYPDPSICRVGNDYYLVNSTFAYYPGITIFHSRDLVNWKLIGYALNNPDEFNLDNAGVSRGLFAPAIRYYEGLFYITCTLVDKGGNFVVTAKNPAGPWSAPVWLPQINGIDPSLFFDDNGRAYIVYNSIPPDDKPLYDGHRTIRVREFDFKNLNVIGEEILLVNGGTDISKKPVWIEAPHIFKINGLYYLTCAEGGTAYNHSEVVFRSKNISAGYTPYEKNPILTQRHLNPERDFPITTTGHADFVETPSGDWWAVFLGCRPYKPYSDDYYNLGRETFMAPVKWQDGWPVITSGNETVKYSYPYPLPVDSAFNGIASAGNIEYKDDFNTDTLDINWQFLRTPRGRWFSLADPKGFLKMNLKAETCSGSMNPAFLCHRQQQNRDDAETALLFSAKKENEKAGLVIFQSEFNYYFLCKSVENNKPVIQLFKSAGKDTTGEKMLLLSSKVIEPENAGKETYLKIHSDWGKCSFYYGFKEGEFLPLLENADGKFLSTKTAGGFVGSVYALYATSTGKPSENSALFDWFGYKAYFDALK